MKKHAGILFLVITLVNVGFSQSLNIDFIFNPGIALGTEYLMPSALNDSTDFQLSKYKIQFSQPLKTKVGIDLKGFNFKEMDAKASQLFLDYNFNVIQPNLTDDNYFETIYTGGVGLTAVKASLRNGIWIYSANIFASENKTTFSESFVPNFRGYVANIKTKDLKTFYFYGAGLLVQQGRLVPFPLLGIKTKIASKFRVELILPVHLKLNYRINKKVSIHGIVSYNGINTVYRQGSTFNGNDQSIYLRQLKTNLSLNAKFGKHYKVKLDVGYASLQQLYSWNNKTGQSLASATFVGFSLNYNFGKSVFGNFMNKGE
tara:strand:- start:9412 stop:10359 length:948 start_codon:yes stop_codon:yes gene_type:complete